MNRVSLETFYVFGVMFRVVKIDFNFIFLEFKTGMSTLNQAEFVVFVVSIGLVF